MKNYSYKNKQLNSTSNSATNPKDNDKLPIPTPSKVQNLHDLDAVRREMAKVYRDMRNNSIPSQDGARLVYVLSELRKLFEACDLEKRLERLEALDV